MSEQVIKDSMPELRRRYARLYYRIQTQYHPDEYKDQKKKYYDQNKEKISEQRKEYQCKNRDKINQRK